MIAWKMKLPPHYPTWWCCPVGKLRVVKDAEDRAAKRAELIDASFRRFYLGGPEAEPTWPPAPLPPIFPPPTSYADLWPPGTDDRLTIGGRGVIERLGLIPAR